MNQVTDIQRGKLNASKTAIESGKSFGEQFQFDMTGNFSRYLYDGNGDDIYEMDQVRTYTKANELHTIATSPSYTAHDRNGNMTKIVKPNAWNTAFNLVYDAWNRLVTVKDNDNATLVAEYAYDGTNRRVLKKTYAGGTLSETRLFYFNSQWQCVEEYLNSETSVNVRYIWGLRYVDDLIMRGRSTDNLYVLQDTNWNVAAVYGPVRKNVAERYAYSAFGKVSVYNVSFATLAASQFAWTRTFTGQVLDAETGLMLYRNRVYHPTLGRFIQRDPIGYDAGDVSLYRYVGNRPLTYFDTLGHQTLHTNNLDRRYRYPDRSTPTKPNPDCGTVSLYDDQDNTTGNVAKAPHFKCLAAVLGNPVPMKGNGIKAATQYASSKKCCISDFNLIDHGGGGAQMVGSVGFSRTDAVELCKSLCDNATITLYGCNAGNPDAKPVAGQPLQAVNYLLEMCPGKIKEIKACSTEVRIPLPYDADCCLKTPPKKENYIPHGACYTISQSDSGENVFSDAWNTFKPH